MCVGFNPYAILKMQAQEAFTAAVAEAASADAHDGVKCENVQQFLIYGKDDDLTIFVRVPLSSDNARLFMFPIQADHLGKNASRLRATVEPLACMAPSIDRVINVGNYVARPEVLRMPAYRSLGCDGGAAAEPEPLRVPTRCVRNADGSATFALFIAETLCLSTTALSAAIASGGYGTLQAYYDTVGKAAFWSLVESMRTNGVVLSNVFPVREDDAAEVAPEAIVFFLHQFLDSLVEGCNVLVHVPAFASDGTPKANAASFVLYYEDAPLSAPLPGLVHNADPADPRLTSEVEANHYIVSNRPFQGMVGDKEGACRPRTIELLHASRFLPVETEQDEPAKNAFAWPQRNFGLHESSDDETGVDEVASDQAWREACSRFQEAVQLAIVGDVRSACTKMGLPSDFEAPALYFTNLVGRRFPKKTVAFTHRRFECSDNSVASIRRRELKASSDAAKRTRPS